MRNKYRRKEKGMKKTSNERKNKKVTSKNTIKDKNQ